MVKANSDLVRYSQLVTTHSHVSEENGELYAMLRTNTQKHLEPTKISLLQKLQMMISHSISFLQKKSPYRQSSTSVATTMKEQDMTTLRALMQECTETYTLVPMNTDQQVFLSAHTSRFPT